MAPYHRVVNTFQYPVADFLNHLLRISRISIILLKGEVHPKMKVSYRVVFGALSRMVKVRGACEKPFWVYARLNKLRRPRAGKLMTV